MKLPRVLFSRIFPGLTIALLAVPLWAQAAKPVMTGQGQEVRTTSSVPQELDGQLVYQFLLAEMALQRDHPELARDLYLKLAQVTHDPRVDRRAVEVSLYSHDEPAAIEAIGLWLRDNPHSSNAREVLAAVMLSQAQMPDVSGVWEKLLADDKQDRLNDFRNLDLVLAQHPDHEGALALAKKLAEPYPDMAESHYLVGTQALAAKKLALALEESRTALEIRPDWESAALLEGEVLQKQGHRNEARDFYQGFLKKNPGARDVQLYFARYLVENKDYAAAREQFDQLLKGAPKNPDLTLAVGLLTLQLKDYSQATVLFKKALELGYHDPNVVRLYLGESYEEQKKWDEAGQWYGAVTEGDQYMVARIREANMWARQNQLDKGLALLDSIPANTPEQRDQKILARESMLSDAGQYQAAFDTLTSALKATPDDTDLLYERAIVADKLGHMDVLEHDLRRVIALKPQNAQAYNALGYSLADHSLRLNEAKGLIHKALMLSPEDPSIIDSLGWVQFRMGDLTKSVETLQQAYTLQDDPEIAAHLGEAQWVSGDQAAARKTWEGGLKTDPENETLKATVSRYLH